MERIYLDHAATTPVAPRVLKTMQPYFSGEFGNPGSLHSFGQAAIAAVDKAREKISSALGADFREIIFAGSATEANNLALKGAVRAARGKFAHPRIIVSAVEHESVLEVARDLKKEGIEAIYLPVDKNGHVKAGALRKALTPETVLVSIMYVNNETGAIQPLAEIGKIIREFRGRNIYPLFHTDAAQALNLLDCRPQDLGADLMTLSAHKIGGPKGVGALYIRKGSPIEHLLSGGGQEFGLRSATENVAGIAGFGKAVELAIKEQAANRRHIEKVRSAFLSGLRRIFPKFRLNGGEGSPHIANIHLAGHKAEDMLTRLDLLGVAVSSGSACRARAAKPSYVLRAMGISPKDAAESIRVSFGSRTTPADIRAALRAFRIALK